MLFQNTSDPSDGLGEEQIWNYIGTFKRTSLVPVYPLHRLVTASSVGHVPHPTIYRSHRQVIVPFGTTRCLKLPTGYLAVPPGYLELPTVTLSFDLPQWVLNCPASGYIHIPLAMWSDKEPTRISEDDRAADLQIGISEVKSAIYYHLVARRRALEKGVDTSTLTPLFGQILLRQFASVMIQSLRTFVFEVPREFWVFKFDKMQGATALLWDSESYRRHQRSYSGPLGRFSFALDGTRTIVTLIFEVKVELPRSPPITWRHSLYTSDLESDVDDIRNRVVREISLEADPPIHPQHEPSDVIDDSIAIA